MDARQRILIVEDEPSLLAVLIRTCETYFVPVTAGSVSQAEQAISSEAEDVVAAIVDIGLPDGDGLKLVKQLRDKSPDMPILVVTGSNERETINQAQLLRAEYVVKPFYQDNVGGFVQRALAHSSSLDKDKLQAVVAQVSGDHRLSQREAQILIKAVEGVPRRHIAQVLGVSENTVKTQVRSLLDKLGKETVSEAVWWVRSMAEPKH